MATERQKAYWRERAARLYAENSALFMESYKVECGESGVLRKPRDYNAPVTDKELRTILPLQRAENPALFEWLEYCYSAENPFRRTAPIKTQRAERVSHQRGKDLLKKSSALL